MSKWTHTDRRIGMWSALIILFLGVAYMIIGFIGALSGGGFWPPKQVDPFLAVLESIIILMSPCMIAMMAAIHAYSTPNTKTYSLAALGLMILLAGVTTSVQFVRLTILRRIDTGLPPDLFLYIDLFAWDGFFGLAMLFAAPVFKGGKLEKRIRVAMVVSGLLCLIGLIGPFSGDLRFQAFGILGYTVVFLVVCMLLYKLFTRNMYIPDEAR